MIKLGNKLEDEEFLACGHSVTRPDHVSNFLRQSIEKQNKRSTLLGDGDGS